MFIPVIAVAVLLLFFQHRTKWWEIGIPLLASALMIGGFKWMAESMGTKDMEIWNVGTVSSHYYEKWDEYIHQTCYNTVCSGSGQNQTCTQIPYDCSYVSTHRARWSIHDSNGMKHGVEKKTYDYFVKLFGMQPQYVDMKRNFHRIDGDMYQVLWPKTDPTVEPVNISHKYENRIQASRSVFKYVELSEEEVAQHKLFEYPEVSLFGYPSILGDCGPTTEDGNKRLRFHNSMLGREKQLRMWILCTDAADPQWGQLQESHWVGGNKNEAVLVVGKGWDHVFTWADDKTPMIETRDFVKANLESLDMVEVADVMAANLKQSFVRKEFADFSYLTVEPPTWAIVMTYIFTILINVGISYFVIHNEWSDDPNHRRYARNRRY